MLRGSLIDKNTRKHTMIVSESNKTLEEVTLVDKRINAKDPLRFCFEGIDGKSIIDLRAKDPVGSQYKIITDFTVTGSSKVMLPVILDDRVIAVNVYSEYMISLDIKDIIYGRLYSYPGDPNKIVLLCYSGNNRKTFTEAIVVIDSAEVSIKKYDKEPEYTNAIYCNAIRYEYFAGILEYVPICNDTIIVAGHVYRTI